MGMKGRDIIADVSALYVFILRYLSLYGQPEAGYLYYYTLRFAPLQNRSILFRFVQHIAVLDTGTA